MDDAVQANQTLLCLTALCLTKTKWSHDFLSAVGLVLDIPESAIDGARTLLFSPRAASSSNHPEDSNNNDTIMLDHAEALAAGFRCRLTPELAIQGWCRMLWTVLRDGQDLAASFKKNPLKQKPRALLERVLHFDGRTSVVLRRLAFLLRIRYSAVAALEEMALRSMQLAALQSNGKNDNSDNNNNNNNNNNASSSSTSPNSKPPEDKKGKRWIRAAKIGAAATAAGGLLFVTGGLAAPALATGLASLGLAGVATLATTTTVATLLGAGGAGLAGYKMTRRTAGLKHFEFQKITNHCNHDNKNTKDDADEMKGMTVYVCVSGYLRQTGPAIQPPNVGQQQQQQQKDDTSPPTTPNKTNNSNTKSSTPDFVRKSSSFLKASTQKLTASTQKLTAPTKDAAQAPDFYGTWGVEPPHMFPTHVVERFYSVVDPQKVKLASHLVEAFPGQEEQVMNRLAEIYKIHPRDIEPAEAQLEYHVTGETSELYGKLLQHVSTTMAAASNKESGGKFKMKKNKEVQEAPTSDFEFSETILNLVVDSEKPWGDEYHVTKKPDAFGDVSASVSGELLDEEEVQKTFEEVDQMADDEQQDEKKTANETMDASTLKSLEQEIKLLDIGDLPDATEGTEQSDEGSEEKEEKKRPGEVYWWRQSVARYGDQYTVIYDPPKLLEVAKCFQNLVAEGVNKGVQQGLKLTALSAVVTAVTFPLVIVSVLNNLDESWAMACEAADEAGVLMAEALMAESSGNRPVVLIGYSVGGRVVTSCLSELAKIAWGLETKKGKKDEADVSEAAAANPNIEFLTDMIENDKTINEKERHRRLRAATIVRDAVLIGVPTAVSPVDKWRLRRSVVCGRFVNAYCEKDWVLSILYRYKRKTVVSLAGLKPVSLEATDPQGVTSQFHVAPMENMSVSNLVAHHGDYPTRIKDILETVGIGDVQGEEFHSNYFL